MGLSKNYIWSICLIFLTGCTSFSDPLHKDVYAQGYRQGVKENIKDVAAQFQGGNFPYYHWTAPIVQDVRIPAHLTNGVMIPEHNELVIIEPGQWSIQRAYPIQTQENKTDENKISYMDVSNITALPKSTSSH